MDFFERLNQNSGELCLLYRHMARNMKRYYQAWELRQQNKTFKDIGEIMEITGSRAAVLCNFVDFKIKYQNRWKISNELKELIKKCRQPKPEEGVIGKPPERSQVTRRYLAKRRRTCPP